MLLNLIILWVLLCESFNQSEMIKGLMINFDSTKFSYDKILSYVEKAKAAGGEIICGGTG